MNGNNLKKLILSEGLTIAEIARRIGTSQQNLTCSLGKEDIKTGLLERIAEAMDKPLSFFYGEKYGPLQSVGNNNTQVTQVAGNSNVLNAEATDILKSQLDEKDSQIRKSQEQIDRLLSIIEKKTIQ